MFEIDKQSFRGSCGSYDKNILNCFSVNGVCFKNEIARYAEVSIIL